MKKYLILLLAAMSAAMAQSVNLSLGSGSGLPGSVVSLPITLTASGGAAPTAVQWSFGANAGIASYTVTIDPSLASAGKTLSCGPSNCLIFGLNSTPIPNGTIATASFTLAANASGTLAILMTNLVASDTQNSIPTTAGNGSIVVTVVTPPVTLSSLTCASGSVQTPGTVSCTVGLSAAALSGGFTVNLASNVGNLTVPSTVTVSASQTSASFTATATAVSADAAATITASAGGSTSQTANVTLLAPAALSSLTCSPGSLNSGQSSTCTVTLTKASVGTTTVTLSDDTAQLTTPGSVAIANGASGNTFTVTAGTIASAQTATVTASLSGVTRTSQINLVAPAGLSSLSCTPNTFSAAGSSSCTVQLVSAAASNTVVTLSSGSVNVTVPASVTVLQGQSNTTFTASVAAVTVSENPQVTASLNGGTQSAAFTLTAPAPAALSSLTCSPGSLNSGQSSTCTVTLTKASVGTTTVTLSDDTAQLTTPGSVAIANGASGNTFTVTAGTIASAQTATVTASLSGVTRTSQINLVAPAGLSSLSCTPNTFSAAGSSSCTVQLVSAAASNTVVTLSSGSVNVTVPASVTVLQGQSNTTFTASVAAVTVSENPQVTASLNGGTQSAAFTLTAPAPAALSSLTCSPGSLNSGQSSTCTVTLTKASVGTTTVTLSDDTAQLTTPGSVAIANGASGNTFTVTAGTIASAQTATVTASLSGVLRTSQVSLVAPTGLSSVSCTPNIFSAAGASSCTVYLVGSAASNTVVTLSSGSSHVTVPATATILQGQSNTSFLANVAAVTANESVQVSASLSGGLQSATLTLNAPVLPAALTSLTCTPGSLTGGQTASCTVTLDKASSGVTTVSLSSNSAQLTTPASVAISDGAASNTFSASAGTITTSQTATVTASLNGVTRTASVNLVAPAPGQLSSLTCTPNTFSAAGSSACTVTLTAPAAAATVVALADNSANVTTPATVTVPQGATSAPFNATVAAVTANETPTITASLNGGSQAATLTLNAPAVPADLSGVSCTPASLANNQTATCTVTLTKASIGTTTITLIDDSNPLATPASVTVPAGQITGTFTVTATGITANQTATITASLNATTRTTTVNLVAPVAAPTDLTSLVCSPTSVQFGGTAVCTVTLSGPAAAPVTVNLNSSSDSIAVAATVSVPTGDSSAQFRVNIPLSTPDTSVVLTAVLGTVSRTSTLSLVAAPSATKLISLGCSPATLRRGQSGTCTASLSGTAADNLPVDLANDNPNLTVPATLVIATGTSSQLFTITAPSTINSAQTAHLTASLNGQSVNATITLDPSVPLPDLQSFSCSPTFVPSGTTATCTVSIGTALPAAAPLNLKSDNALVQVPSQLTFPTGAAFVTFPIQAGNVTAPQTVNLSAAWDGGTPLVRAIQVTLGPLTLNVPDAVFTRAGSAVTFDASATNSTGSHTVIQAAGLPPGASFDGAHFAWTPSNPQVGEFPVVVTATDDSGLTKSATVRVVVRQTVPTITGLFNPAGYTPADSCSPNAIMTFVGVGFSLHDPTGASSNPLPTELAGVRVSINGDYAPLAFVSDTTIHFQCPDLAPGVQLSMVLEYEGALAKESTAFAANAVLSIAPVVSKMSVATPGVYVVGGTQGAVLISGTGLVAGPPLDQYQSRAALPGEYLEIYANGMGTTTEILPPGQPAPLDHLIRLTAGVTAIFGDGVRTPVAFAGLTPGGVGLFQVNVQVPPGTQVGDTVPLVLEMVLDDGTIVRTNTVTVAIAASR